MLKFKGFHNSSLDGTLALNDVLKFKKYPVNLNCRQNDTGELTDDLKEYLEYLRIEDASQDIPKMIQGGAGPSCIRELSLSHTLLNADLLRVISSASDDLQLEILKIDVHPDVIVDKEAWLTLDFTPLAKFTVAMNCYIENDTDYEAVFTNASIPITHLFLNGPVSATAINIINKNCSSKLIELIIASYAPGIMDDQLLFSIAEAFPKLVALGLGECEITCTALVTFADMSKDHLQVLYIWETSLIDDAHFDVTSAATKVSSILGQDWTPEYVPPW